MSKGNRCYRDTCRNVAQQWQAERLSVASIQSDAIRSALNINSVGKLSKTEVWCPRLPSAVFVVRKKSGNTLFQEAWASHLRRSSQPFHYQPVGINTQLFETVRFTRPIGLFQTATELSVCFLSTIAIGLLPKLLVKLPCPEICGPQTFDLLGSSHLLGLVTFHVSFIHWVI